MATDKKLDNEPSVDIDTSLVRQLADILAPIFPVGGSLLEVGVGEATTLSTVSRFLAPAPSAVLGFDVSWSRCAVAVSNIAVACSTRPWP